MKDLFKGSLTVPNLLTVIRILLIPVFAALFYNDNLGWALVILFISGLTDLLDGKIARRFNQVSALGKILDPIADKLTQITIAVMLFFEFNRAQNTILKAFSWVFLLFLLKEGIMLVGGAVMLAKGIRPGASEIVGKVATLVFYCVMLIIIGFGPEVGALAKYNPESTLILPDWLLIVMVSVSVILAFAAFISYLPEIIRQFKEDAREKKNK